MLKTRIYVGRVIFFFGVFLAGFVTLAGPFSVWRDIRHPLLIAAAGYGLCAFRAGDWPWRKEIIHALSAKYFPWCLSGFASFLFVRVKILDWMSGRISGTDFSHLDYAVWSTVQGRLMQIPILLPQPTYNDMFGNHYSPILFLYAAARALFDSPITSLVIHALSLSLPIPVLHAVARKVVDRPVASMLCMTYFMCGSVASTLQYDFHHESFFVLGFALLFYGIFYHAAWLWIGAVLTLSVKEDAGIYLPPILLLFAYYYPERRKHMVGLAAISLVWLIFALKIAMPWHQPVDKPAPSLYFTFWSRYGTSYGEALKTMISHPHRVIGDLVLNLSVYKHLLPWGFLPLITPIGLAALPPLLVLVTATGIPRGLGLYYGITLVPLFFLATAYGLKRFKRPMPIACVLLGLAAFVGGNYFRFHQKSPDYAEWTKLGSNSTGWFRDAQPVWVPAGLLPFLPYTTYWRRLDDIDQIAGERQWPVLVFLGEQPMGYLLLTPQKLANGLEARGYRKV